MPLIIAWGILPDAINPIFRFSSEEDISKATQLLEWRNFPKKLSALSVQKKVGKKLTTVHEIHVYGDMLYLLHSGLNQRFSV